MTPRPDNLSQADAAVPAAAGLALAQPVQAVERAIALLKAIAAEGPATRQELADSVGLNRSTVWRLLATLERHGLVERAPATGLYSIGYAALSIAAADNDSIARRLRPALELLAEAQSESVTIAVAKRFNLVYIDQVDPPGVVSASWLDMPLPLHATSGGKAFLAWLPERERQTALPAELEAYTPNTITQRDRLEAELAQVRRVGYAVCDAEYEPFSSGVAAAALDRRGRPLVIVNLWGPPPRVGTGSFDRLGPAVVRTAKEVTALLA
jgi:DNA-binding IclR family transcriptional regulator